MLNIKSVFVPSGSAAPMNSMDAAQQNVGPTPQKPIKSGFNSVKSRLFLGAAFLFLTIIGGASALYLSTTGQDLRQQASGLYGDCAGVPGCGKACDEIATGSNGAYCGSTAPNSCLRCVDGIAKGAPNSACYGLPCDANSIFNKPKCSGGAEPGQAACGGTTPDTCKVCTLQNKDPLKSPQATWETDPSGGAACAGLVCSGVASPTPGAAGSCGTIGFKPDTSSCSTINADGCFAYRTCHTGSNYDACVPAAGTNMCTYTTKTGAKCTAPCPGSVGELGTGAARCTCSNGQTTIGVLPPGGSCDQLCACTGNVCKDCKPTDKPNQPTKVPPTATPKPPTPTPVPPTATPVPPAQCTNIKMLTPAGAELTGDADKTLKPGDAVKFMCAANGAVARYEFRVIMPDNKVQDASNNPNLVAVGATTGNFTLPAIGKFTVQCRICTMPVCPPGAVCKLGGTPICQEYEPYSGSLITPVTTTTQSCGGIQGLTCPSGYSCNAPAGTPDAMGTCVLAAAPKGTGN